MNLDTASVIETLLRSTSRIMQDRVAVTLVTDAMSKIVRLVTEGEEKGRSLCEKNPKGKLKMVRELFETLRMPPVKAPALRQCSTTLQTGPQLYCWAMVMAISKVPTMCIIASMLNYIQSQIPSVNLVQKMKAIFTPQSDKPSEYQQSSPLKTRLHQLQLQNKEREGTICQLELEVALMEKTNAELQAELQRNEKELEALREGEGEGEMEIQEQQVQEMQEWIEQVQKYNGLPQQAIDSLLTIEFQGEQEICPACFGELAYGAMCTYLPCAHLFHRDCIANHLKVNRFCLACQEPVQM